MYCMYTFFIQFSLFIISFLDLSVSPCLFLSWRSHDPSQYSDDVFKQWCMKFRQIKTFVLPHWLIIWQIGPCCVWILWRSPLLPIPHPIKRPLAEKNSSIASLFYSLLEDYIFFFTTFWSDKMGENCGFFGGGPCELRQWQRGPGQQSVAV